MYNNCNECPFNNTADCPFSDRSQEMRQNICLFLPLRIRPFHKVDPGWIEQKADELVEKIKSYMPEEAPETVFTYEDFFHIAFAADTPEQQARHFQDVLVSAAAIADFRKLDITRYTFILDNSGKARAEPPQKFPLS